MVRVPSLAKGTCLDEKQVCASTKRPGTGGRVFFFVSSPGNSLKYNVLNSGTKRVKRRKLHALREKKRLRVGKSVEIEEEVFFSQKR